MTANEAIQRLDDMGDGRPQFKEIADVLREAKEIIGFIPTINADRTYITRRAQKWLRE